MQLLLFFAWAYYSGYKHELAYRQVIADLQTQLSQNPVKFFQPHYHFHPNNYIGNDELIALLIEKVIMLSLQRNIRSNFNANIIPSDIQTLPDANQAFQRLYSLAYSIANDRH
ncbi:hypothetical protein [Moraxella sp. VT-16-12]|uniref:hypothetical protein n=1 Tax=Moraxella sp. VT-16-12 TaxID=2014877 RepID=UPI0021042139|nr:hypothetical protein [Moraxella sp. VT-16-12]